MAKLGKRTRLKILRSKDLTGSIPVAGTNGYGIYSYSRVFGEYHIRGEKGGKEASRASSRIGALDSL